MQNYRLFQIMYLLMDKKRITAKELAEIFEVSIRTIYRDIDVLSMAGIPIYTDRGSGGGIALMDHFKISRTLLSEIEQETILTGVSSVSLPESINDNKDARQHLAVKLRALFQKDDIPTVRIHASGWSQRHREQENMAIFKQAIQLQQAMHITYVNNNGKKSQRDIYPLQLLFKGSAWYVVCFCLWRQSIRLFKLQRIIASKDKEIHFVRNDYVDLMKQTEEKLKPHDDIPYMQVTLTLKPQAMAQLYDYFDDADIITLPDGNIQVNLTLPKEDWAYGYLTSFYPYVLSMKPDAILQKLQKFLQKRHEYFSNMT